MADPRGVRGHVEGHAEKEMMESSAPVSIKPQSQMCDGLAPGKVRVHVMFSRWPEMSLAQKT